ncbi:hypothetical protein L1987_71034 [Smallanthus sonchifolius]|uniref:Uncharacterized protein n=1 Tax=Smallanthus sonchifolius TaxID=185202 RepID=A0ACB9AQI0_9ASTR|nr:hypothetical protein L1987_71034 [Smallanthus sonchifolius]
MGLLCRNFCRGTPLPSSDATRKGRYRGCTSFWWNCKSESVFADVDSHRMTKSGLVIRKSLFAADCR